MKKKIPILYLDNTFTFGGAINSLLYLLRALDKEKYEPVLVTGQSETFLKKHFEFIKWYHTPIRVPWIHNRIYKQIIRLPFCSYKIVLKVIKRFRFLYWILFITIPEAIKYSRIGRKHKIQIVHLNNILGSQLAGIIAAKLLRVPCVAHLRDFEQVDCVTKFYAKFIDHHIAISNEIKNNLLALGISESKISLVWDAIDLDDFNLELSPSTLDEEFQRASDEKFFGIFGRVIGWKGVKEFILASAQVFQEFPNSRALIVGDSSDGDMDYFAELKELVRQLDIQEKVVFTGFREDIPELMKQMDIVVHSSIKPEPFGMVLIEGMAVGKPIVATKAGGPLDIVENMETGILVDISDVGEMANAIVYLLKNEELALDMGKAGEERVKKYFVKERYAQLVESVYCRLIT